VPVRTSAWPIEALPFEQSLTLVVESFLDIAGGRAFDWRREATQQLYERVDQLGALPDKNALLALIRQKFGEFACLTICNSGFRDLMAVPKKDMWQAD
jgi:hypothetical protein